MNCLVNPDHADDEQNTGRYDSIETERRIFMNSPRTCVTTGFNRLMFWKLEGENFPRLAKWLELFLLLLQLVQAMREAFH
jgi:hypothetical protein